MDSPKPTHLLFDFFGTLVDYNPSNTEQDFSASHQIVRACGSSLEYEEFLDLGRRAFGDLDQQCAHSLDEFSMRDAAATILQEAAGRPGTPAELDRFVASYLADWNSGVHYPDRIDELLRRLADHHRLAVVSNTHDPSLVPDHLAAMGVAELFDVVVLSVEVGRRKPHPDIYRYALDALGIDAGTALFIGDTPAADYDGPQQLGIRALLIDPDRKAAVPDEDRIASVFDLTERL